MDLKKLGAIAICIIVFLGVRHFFGSLAADLDPYIRKANDATRSLSRIMDKIHDRQSAEAALPELREGYQNLYDTLQEIVDYEVNHKSTLGHRGHTSLWEEYKAAQSYLLEKTEHLIKLNNTGEHFCLEFARIRAQLVKNIFSMVERYPEIDKLPTFDPDDEEGNAIIKAMKEINSNDSIATVYIIGNQKGERSKTVEHSVKGAIKPGIKYIYENDDWLGTLYVTPVENVNTLISTFNFGEVKEIDTERRIFNLELDSSKFPTVASSRTTPHVFSSTPPSTSSTPPVFSSTPPSIDHTDGHNENDSSFMDDPSSAEENSDDRVPQIGSHPIPDDIANRIPPDIANRIPPDIASRFPGLGDPSVVNPSNPQFVKNNIKLLQTGTIKEKKAALLRLCTVSAQLASADEDRKIVAPAIKSFIDQKDNSVFDRAKAIKGLPVWGGSYSTPILLDIIKSDNFGPIARACFEALAQLKDPRSAETLVDVMLNDHMNSDEAAECLKAIGPVAEEAVLKAPKPKDFIVAEKVIEVLGEIGGRKSLLKLSSYRREDFYRMVQSEVEEARAKIQRRMNTGG